MDCTAQLWPGEATTGGVGGDTTGSEGEGAVGTSVLVVACVRSRILADRRNSPGAVVCTPSRTDAGDTVSAATTVSHPMTGGSSVGSMAMSSTAETSGAGTLAQG